SAALGQNGPSLLSEESTVNETFEQLQAAYDAVHSGFGGAPKFPLSAAHQFLLYRATSAGDVLAGDLLVRTLDTMHRRDIFDGAEGGFFRYSTSRNWNAPHYEKMLETNALLLNDSLPAGHLLDNDSYRATARRVLEYLDTTLSDPDTGAFFAS